MADVNYTAIAPGGTRTTQFNIDGTSENRFIFPSPQTVLHITNTGTLGWSAFIDRYNAAGDYEGNVTHITLLPTNLATLSWPGADPNFAGIGINGDQLAAGTYHARLTYQDIQYCAYGTRRQASAAANYFIGPALVLSWLNTLGAADLFPLFAVLYGQSFDVDELCSSGPPPMPPLDLDLLTAPIPTVLAVLRAVAWPSLCECVPGTPPPNVYPPPVVVVPPNWPTQIPFPCDPAALCDAIQRLVQLVNAIGRTTTSDLAIDTAVQRFGVPFASIRGTRHAGLTGTGTVTPQKPPLLGVLVECTAFPPENRQFTGVPPYISDLGWISVLTGDGMIDEIRLTRQSQVWQSRLIPQATVLGYGLRDGVVADITEILPEA